MADPTAWEARDALGQSGAQADRAAEAVKQSASRIGEQMREAAESFVREQQDRLATSVHDLAQALRRAADTLEHEDRSVAARYADQAAAQIDRLSETMRRQQLREMLSNAGDFARRQPALFVTGAVAAGFILGRLLSTSSRRHREMQRIEGFATTGGESIYHAAAEAEGDATAGYAAHAERV